MVQYGRPSRSSWAKSVRSSFGRTIMGKAIWENTITARLGECFQWGMLIRTPWKRVILICVCGWHKIGWHETKTLIRCGAITQQRSRVGRTNFFLWSCVPGTHSMTMWNKQRYCGQLQNHVWIAIFRGENRKAFILWEFSYVFMVLWYGRQRSVWSDICELSNKTTQQLYKVSTPCSDDHHFEEEELKSVGELSQVCSQIVLFFLARIGRPDILWSVNKLERSDYKLDQSLWQTPESIDILHSSHMWIQTVLSM